MTTVTQTPKLDNPGPQCDCPFARLVSAKARQRKCVRPFRDRHFGTEGPAVVEVAGQRFVVRKVVDEHGVVIGLRLWDEHGKCLAAKSVNLTSIGLLFVLLQNDSF